jgi:DinB superfamily
MSEDLRYPIGKFVYDESAEKKNRNVAIKAIGELPARLRLAIVGLSMRQMKTPYRPGGWTLNQLIHHVADSHMNSFIRFKLALTEDAPMIKTNNEAPELSLKIIDALHERWFLLLKSLKESDFSKKLTHPEHGLIDLRYLVALYEWHGKHHTAHITKLRERENW